MNPPPSIAPSGTSMPTQHSCPEPSPSAVKTSSVTVIVPVRNESAFLGRTLDQLLAQNRDGIQLEILIVDGQSTDNTLHIAHDYAARHPEIRVLQNPKRLSSAARNLAIKNSTGEYVVIIDGHCEIPTRRYYDAMVEAFERSGADCLGRPQPLDVTGATPLQQAIALARSSRLGHHPESFIYSSQGQFVPAKSVAVAYRRSVFDKVGLFDESMDAHEDGEFNYRCDQAGLTCYLAPEITVRYFPRSRLRSLFRQMVRYARGRVRFSRKHAGTWGLGTLIPAVLVLCIAAGAILAAVVPVLRTPYLVGVGVYLALILVGAFRVSWRTSQPELAWKVPFVFLAVHLGAGCGTWLELLRPLLPRTAFLHRSP